MPRKSAKPGSTPDQASHTAPDPGLDGDANAGSRGTHGGTEKRGPEITKEEIDALLDLEEDRADGGAVQLISQEEFEELLKDPDEPPDGPLDRNPED